ncbi:unnamed protein product [Adineta steineri]|uniref:EGF-like domain-containing protein n=1 Tax=Adineta steineri TaxID=433720 RepID=A0A815RB21_9BILA|nr:unnamed protein product [Adineta steineri]
MISLSVYRLVVVGLFFQWIMPSNGVAVCNDTASWISSAGHPCNDYHFNTSWCVNGYFQPSTYWTGGSLFLYPEFNCCDCGKGWPVWFVPNAGYEATKAVPELTDNGGNSNVTDLKCIDPMGNSGLCNMACKTWEYPVISLTNITNNNFDFYNCTLSLQTINASMSYTLQIPQNNYIVYFTNWTTDDYNFSCLGATPPSNSSMLCRHDVAQCLSPATTYRCVSPGMYSQLRKSNISEPTFYLDCIDTPNWINNNTANSEPTAFTCYSYEVGYRVCSGGTVTSGNQWALGSMYNYPEFNCCGCGKGWPLWFVPLAGFAATRAVPEFTNNTQNSNVTNLQCIDSYGNSRTCNMTCKLWTNPLTSIETITNDDFDWFNCTLIIRSMNASISYVVQIPSDNYLVYFSNWTTSDYNFLCEGNRALPNVSMVCRHDFMQCLSTEVTNRYVPADCVDTANWTNLYTGSPNHKGYSCFEYEFLFGMCTGGTFTPSSQWSLGKNFNFPELNCCACGKGSQTPYKLVDISPKSSSTIPSDVDVIELYNCIASPTYFNLRFNFKCLGPSSFIKINTTANTTLYNCPINCFFDRNHTTIDMTQSVNITRQQTGINATYYLFSNLFPNFQVICGTDNTQFPTLPPTSSEVDDQDTSEIPTTYTSFSPVVSSSFKATTYAEETTTTISPIGSSTFKATMYVEETTTTASPVGSSSFKATIYAEETTSSVGSSSIKATTYVEETTITASPIGSSSFKATTHAEGTTTTTSPVGSSSLKTATYAEETTITASPVGSSSFKTTTHAEETTTTISPVGSSSFKATTYAEETTTTASLIGSSSLKATTYAEETTTTVSPIGSSSFKTTTYAGETTTTTSLVVSSSFKATTYAGETTTTALITFVTVATLSPSPVWQSPTCINGNIGLNCNVTVDLCQITNPCLNNGSCINTLSSTYTCTCMQGFTGSHCEIDIRPCKPWTCLSYGLCNETSPTTFQCECYPGYEGLNCESLTDYCDGIVCQNNGQCRPILLNFTCECTTKDVTGRYCEIKSNSLVIKAAVKRSVGYIAIVAIIGVISIFVGFDALTYIFKIDTVKRHRKYLAKRRRQQRERQSKPKSVIRFVYVNASPDESTIES